VISDISIIIPTYNEKGNIEILLEKILKKSFVKEVIIIDDGSDDGTLDVIKRFATKDKRVRLIERGKKLGLGSAYKDGIKLVSSNWFITMDADLSHNPEHIEDFIQEIEGADIIIGSRNIVGSKIIGWNIYRRVAHIVANSLAKKILGLKYTDITSGYRLYKTNLMKSILPLVRSNNFNFQVEVLFYADILGFKIKEIPIIFVNRKIGKSKFNFKEGIEFIKLLINLFIIKVKLSQLS